MGELPAMSKFKNSMILMGINWSKAARIIARRDISCESPELDNMLNDLDNYYRKTIKAQLIS